MRGCTEGVNLVAHGYGRKFIGEGDEIIISAMEHHANIVPWQMLCEEKGAILQVIPMNERGELIIDEYENLLNERTKLVSIIHVSNALGTINPVKEMIATAHKFGVPVMIDGAQAVPHMAVDVQDLDADFYTFSGHKMFAPTGSGVLYGKKELLEKMNPFQGGGDMIRTVTFEKTTYAGLPNKFEAGTPAIASNIGLGAAVDYLNSIDREAAFAYEEESARIRDRKTLRNRRRSHHRHGKRKSVGAVVHHRKRSPARHRHDFGPTGIAIRAGHHCAQPVMQFFEVPATARASFAFYNTREEVDNLAEAVQKVIEVFA